MDPPQPLSATNSSNQLAYPESLESCSPRSRNTESWDEPPPQVPGAKLRLMCSYGGHIVPRPHDKCLCYLGGDTRIIVVERHTSLADLSFRLSRTLLTGRPFTLKYQLPNEDLDSLISVTTDEDLDNMIEEYDRTSSASSLGKSSRLRLFLFPTKPETSSSVGTLLDDSKSENWFVDALNGSGVLPRGYSADTASVNCLLSLDDDVVASGRAAVVVDTRADVEAQNNDSSLGNNLKQVKSGQDVHSVPDSPMLDTNSSFGSSTSSPSMANLPPIRVHVEDQKMGLEEQFAQISVATTTTVAPPVSIPIPKQEEGFVVIQSSPPPLPTTIVSAIGVQPSSTGNSENHVYSNRVISDDERSDQGAPLTGFRKPPQPPQQRTSGGVDFPSPDATARDNSLQDGMSRGKPMYYQEQFVQVASREPKIPANSVDPKRDVLNPSYRVQMQQHESGYMLASQLDQQQQLQQQQQVQQQQLQQQQHQQHQQLQQQQQQQQQLQQQQQQQVQQQQQQYIHGGTHYVQQHHPTQPMPMSSYYPIHPQQQHHQQLDPHYPMYYVTVPQSQAYNMSMQSNISEAASNPSSRPPIPPNPTILPTSSAYKEAAPSVYPSRSSVPPKPELSASVYRTTNTGTPPLVQVPVDQHFMGYPPHQSVASAAAVAASANYAYEYPDPNHAQIYYTQPVGSTLHSQYQTMSAAAAVAVTEANENAKQQIRTQQPL